jgi:hypothetical protein
MKSKSSVADALESAFIETLYDLREGTRSGQIEDSQALLTVLKIVGCSKHAFLEIY